MSRCSPFGGVLRRWMSSMQPRIHPCVCGVQQKTYGSMRKHRLVCQEWLDRSDPRGLAIKRRSVSRKVQVREFIPCPTCKGRMDGHEPGCPHDPGDMARRAALLRHGLDPVFFEAFLRVLARCYEVTVPSIPPTRVDP